MPDPKKPTTIAGDRDAPVTRAFSPTRRPIQTAEEAEQLPADALAAGWRSDAAGKPVRIGMAEAA